MKLSRDAAHNMAQARDRFASVLQGELLLCVPYVPGGSYTLTHYLPPPYKKSVICGGEHCQWHHLPPIAKMHIPAWVLNQRLPYSELEHITLGARIAFDAGKWSQKIVELTENCFKAFEQFSDPDTFAYLRRAPGKRNNAVEFGWLHKHVLFGQPSEVLSVDQILPAVIHNQYFNDRQVEVDNSRESRIKHNRFYPTGNAVGQDSDNSEEGIAAGIKPSPRARTMDCDQCGKPMTEHAPKPSAFGVQTHVCLACNPAEKGGAA